ncbi:MAG TPA: hypothetical protein DCZ03_05595 [Gammaproteobacteria bacterium]|nr:hypothetical protein [Gammaproteobacteria bacterium]
MNLSLLAKSVTRVVARGQNGVKLPILIYHRVHPEGYPLPTDMMAKQFEWQMSLLRAYFAPLSLVDALEQLQQGDLKPGSVCITFDDGYEDNLLVALPILERYQIPATFFITTNYIEGGAMWNDYIWESMRDTQHQEVELIELGLGHYSLASEGERLQAGKQIIHAIKYLVPTERLDFASKVVNKLGVHIPKSLMLNADQVKMLHRAGMGIGAHTQSHPILHTLSDNDAKVEIRESKTILENLIQAPVDYFAYPNGKRDQDYSQRDVDLVKNEGFKAALSTEWGVSDRNSDLWQLNRFTPWDDTVFKYLARMWINYYR